MLTGLYVAQTFITDESNAQSKQAGPSLAHLTKFVGKSPSGYEDDKNGKSVKKDGLLDDKAFRQVLMKSLGKRRFNEFMSDDDFGVESPITQRGQILYFMKCEPHRCNMHQAQVFINLVDNSIEIYWVDYPKYYWLSSKKPPRAMQKASCDGIELFEKYGNK